MNINANTIKGGVLFLGSLFWEDEHNAIQKIQDSKDLGKERRKWRKKFLVINKNSVQQIPLPIGYGRKSGSGRRNTFTMVLSRYYWNNQGKGLIAPYIDEINFSNLNSFKAQVKKLAISEGIYTDDNKRFVADWGSAVAIYINPKSLDEKQKKIREKWDKIVVSENGYDKNINKFQWAANDLLLDNGYILNSDLKIETELDFLLCTYMQPNYENSGQKGYPTPQTIGEAIRNNDYSTYFCQNRASGIITADDDKIFNYISKTY